MKNAILLALMLCLGAIAKAEEWQVFDYAKTIDRMVSTEDLIFAAADNSFLKIDIKTGRKKCVGKLNLGEEESLIDMVMDSVGNIWISTTESKILQFNIKSEDLVLRDEQDFNLDKDFYKFNFIDENADYITKKIKSKPILIDSKNNFWIQVVSEEDSNQKPGILKIAGNSSEFMEVEGLMIGIDRNDKPALLKISEGCYYLVKVFNNGFIDEFKLPEISLETNFYDYDGNLWFSGHIIVDLSTLEIDDKGLFKFDGNELEQWDPEAGNPTSGIKKIFCDDMGRVWAISSEGLIFLSNDYFVTDFSNLIPRSNECAFCPATNGGVWVAYQGILVNFGEDSFEPKYLPDPGNEFQMTGFQKLKIDGNNRAYFVQGKGIVRYDGKFRYFQDSRRIDDVAIDKNNELWLLNHDNIKKFRNGDVKSFDISDLNEYPEYLLIDGIPSIENYIIDDRIGNIWIVTRCRRSSWWENWTTFLQTGNGLVKINVDEFDEFEYIKENMPDPLALHIDFDRKGNAWMTTHYYCAESEGDEPTERYNGLSKYDGEKFATYDTTNSPIPSNKIDILRVDGEDNVWLYTSGLALTKYDGRNWSFYYNDLAKIPTKNIAQIAFDTKNRPWILGIISDSLYQLAYLENNRWIFSEDTKINSKGLWNDLKIDKKGNVWIATAGPIPLYKFNEDLEREEITPENSPIPNSAVLVFEIDNDDNLWLGCKTGFAVYNPDGVVLSASAGRENSSNLGLSVRPNPFSQFQITNYELREAGYVTLRVIDMLGREVSTLVDGFREAGRHEARFNAAGLPSGVYLIELRSGEELILKKIMVTQ